VGKTRQQQAAGEADLTDIEGFTYSTPTTEDPKLTTEEVQYAILASSKDKAPGPDEIPNRALHILAHEIPAMLVRLYQEPRAHTYRMRRVGETPWIPICSGKVRTDRILWEGVGENEGLLARMPGRLVGMCQTR
jgi:hypothetical protein